MKAKKIRVEFEDGTWMELSGPDAFAMLQHIMEPPPTSRIGCSCWQIDPSAWIQGLPVIPDPGVERGSKE